MSEPRDTYQRLGEAVLEEIIVRAGLDQPHAAAAGAVPVALQFVVSADAGDRAVRIRGERLGQAPLELRIDLD